MYVVIQQMPIEAPLMIPLCTLSELTAHEDQLTSRVSKHVTEEETQVREFFPFIARHSSQQRSFSMHHFIVRKRQHKVLRESIHDAERNFILMKSSVNWIQLE